ncbi:hypothetical protein IOCL2690_000071700 [Leishmania lindenbergi]|uniref:Uncharacterized protein n=1 Tax=Leishmania lindenbergi TaxID=651832 RepID=A0AAW3AZC9_9TRYP
MQPSQQEVPLLILPDAASPQAHRPDVTVEDSAGVVLIPGCLPATKASALNDLLSFSPFDCFTWWSLAIPGLLVCCTVFSIIIISVCSSRRTAPVVLELMSSQQCSFFSSLQPPVAYTEWMETCASAYRGYAYPCMSQVDCVVLGPRCAPAGMLPQLRCVDTGARADHHAVCAYPSPSPTDAPALFGFCTEAGTSCAICATETCPPTTPSHGSAGCPPTTECDNTSWLCKFL